MKSFKTSLHVLLTFASLMGFLGGWATLAHSRKPVQNTSSTTLEPLPALAPLQTGISSPANNNGSGLITVAPVAPRRTGRSTFTTGGS